MDRDVDCSLNYEAQNIVKGLSSNYPSELTKCPRSLKTKYIKTLKRPYCGEYTAYHRNKTFTHIFPYNLTIVDVLLSYLEIFCRPGDLIS